MHSFSMEAYRPLMLDDLRRCGVRSDGGYVLSNRMITEADVLVSMGISTEWSFEEEILRLRPGIRLVAVDGSVSAAHFRQRVFFSLASAALQAAKGRAGVVGAQLKEARHYRQLRSDFTAFFHRPSRRFICEMIGEKGIASLDWPTLHTMVVNDSGLPAPKMLVKMDIEGSEYRVLPDVLAHAEHIAGLIVEFHDCDLLQVPLVKLLDSISGPFAIAHVHANNCTPIAPAGSIPRTLEFTFVNRKLVSEDELARANTLIYPLDGLDWPNDSRLPDIALFAPRT